MFVIYYWTNKKKFYLHENKNGDVSQRANTGHRVHLLRQLNQMLSECYGAIVKEMEWALEQKKKYSW